MQLDFFSAFFDIGKTYATAFAKYSCFSCQDGKEMKKILVVAGNHHQFQVWLHSQPRELLRFTTYLHDVNQVRGLGPESVERLELVGSWWTSELYRNAGDWTELQERLGERHLPPTGQTQHLEAERSEYDNHLQAWPPDGTERISVDLKSRAFSILYQTRGRAAGAQRQSRIWKVAGGL